MSLFPNSEVFIIGYGSNDLGTKQNLEYTTKQLIANLNLMIAYIKNNSKRPLLINIPYLNTHSLDNRLVQEQNKRRDYCNDKLKDYCLRKTISLIDICSILTKLDFKDSVHPNKKGAKKIALEILNMSPELAHQ